MAGSRSFDFSGDEWYTRERHPFEAGKQMTVFNGKKSAPPAVPPSGSHPVTPDHQASLIGRTLLVKGEVLSDDEVVIEGRIEGRIAVKNRVVVGKNGQVTADIEAREIIVRGRVTGNLKGHYRVEIVPEGVLNGTISAPKVVIADGAIFDGSIDMKTREGVGAARTSAPASSVDGRPPEKAS